MSTRSITILTGRQPSQKIVLIGCSVIQFPVVTQCIKFIILLLCTRPTFVEIKKFKGLLVKSCVGFEHTSWWFESFASEEYRFSNNI